jgi:WhiB family transcriptional regulator, redox-sensing transcriptional regulator
MAADLLGTSPHREPWYPQSRCLGASPEIFFSPIDQERAKATCRGCPVWHECLRWALVHDEQGVWGATTERERVRIRRYLRRPQDAPPPCSICGEAWTIHVGKDKARCLRCNYEWWIELTSKMKAEAE